VVLVVIHVETCCILLGMMLPCPSLGVILSNWEVCTLAARCPVRAEVGATDFARMADPRDQGGSQEIWIGRCKPELDQLTFVQILGNRWTGGVASNSCLCGLNWVKLVRYFSSILCFCCNQW
jgi:hypothetical protein